MKPLPPNWEIDKAFAVLLNVYWWGPWLWHLTYSPACFHLKVNGCNRSTFCRTCGELWENA